MSVKELIKHAIDKDASSFESKFDDIMADKMTSAIETKYADMYGASEVQEVEETEAEAVVDVEAETNEE
tara:strand:- start:2615 stop:2821 length:207 start_codon:yes stop_codon:yes gene_type:complete